MPIIESTERFPLPSRIATRGLILLLIAFCFAAGGCSGWTQAAATGPAVRGLAMAYDTVQQQVMFFGGTTSMGAGGEIAQTWVWNGTAWTQKFPAHSPGPRYKAALASDSVRHRVVLFGGVDGNVELNDTWEWDGNDWTQMHPAHSPPARHHHAMAYDVNHQVVVMFGGYHDPDPADRDDLADTWTWNGTDWTQQMPTNSPPKRDGHAMAYDANIGKAVLFGGAQDVNTLVYLNDTWEWDGMNWTQVNNGSDALGPKVRGNATLAYDDVRQQVILFGGFNFTGTTLTYFNDTFAWNDTLKSWTPLVPATGLLQPTFVGRNEHGMAYDAKTGRKRMVMFGGYTGDPAVLQLDTWERVSP